MPAVLIFISEMNLFTLFGLIIASSYCSAQDASCDFYSNVIVGQPYDVKSPNYPKNYTANIQCRWIGVCPAGYNCVLDCYDVNIPYTQGCTLDKLMVSQSGDPTLSGAQNYCGRGAFSVVSSGQRISVGLITGARTPGGYVACRLYARPATSVPSNCSCGYKKGNRIVGGQETGVNEFPMMAGVVDGRIGMIRCGGVIIAQYYVMTAAHCVYGESAANYGVVVGEHDISTGSETTATKVIRASSFIIHPRYSSSTYDYDVAIIVLQQPITFSNLVGPVCLPFKYNLKDFAGEYVTYLGWGTTQFGGILPDALRKVDTQVITQSSCRAATPSVTDRQMCTYTPGKDACQWDSGGPALYTDKSTGLLFSVGIISSGQNCAGQTPGINTRVTAVLDWVTSVAPAAYCVK